MSDEYSFRLQLDPEEDDVDRLRSQLIAYNTSHTPNEMYTRLLLSVDDEAGRLAAGLYARMHFSWMFVDLLWVAEPVRGLGLGADLLAEAEEQARKHGCHSVWLDTFSFQAPDFYKKQGYEVFAELPDYPAGHRRYFLSKKLS
jgi:GNAT superfamily N-acetyltransferase